MERKIDPHRGVLSTRVTYGLGGRVGMGVARCGVRPVYMAIDVAIAMALAMAIEMAMAIAIIIVSY